MDELNQKILDCISAIDTVMDYIDSEEGSCGCSFWKDKDGKGFRGDIGYFCEGLIDMKAYLEEKLKNEGGGGDG